MWRQKTQDSAKKMISIWGKISSSRFVLSDYAIASSNPFFQNQNSSKPSKGVKSNGTLPIPYPKSRRGLVRFQMSHLWLALESTSKVLNLTCNRTSALPNKGSPCRSSSLTLIIVRCLQRIETIDHSVIDSLKSHTSVENYVVFSDISIEGVHDI